VGTWANWLLGYLIFDRNIKQGAATSIYAATSPALEDHSGAYLVDCKVSFLDVLLWPVSGQLFVLYPTGEALKLEGFWRQGRIFVLHLSSLTPSSACQNVGSFHVLH
jgi:hypothetical protein